MNASIELCVDRVAYVSLVGREILRALDGVGGATKRYARSSVDTAVGVSFLN